MIIIQRSDGATRHAIVTGAAGGLGRAFCRLLARDGWRIAIVDIDQAGAEQTRNEIVEAGGSGQVEICDVTSAADWRSLRDRLRGDWRRLDLLVNNAGMFGSGFVGALDLDAAERVMRLNLLGTLVGCDTMAPWLVESAAETARTRGEARADQQPIAAAPHIINVASAFAHFCPPGMGVYSASKAAVVALSETLYGELRPRGVGVTVVCPGVMPTGFIRDAAFDSPAYQRLTESYVRNSTLAPEAVAAAALRGMRRGELYVVEGARERWFWRLKRLLPTHFLRRVARQVRKDLKAQA